MPSEPSTTYVDRRTENYEPGMLALAAVRQVVRARLRSVPTRNTRAGACERAESAKTEHRGCRV